MVARREFEKLGVRADTRGRLSIGRVVALIGRRNRVPGRRTDTIRDGNPSIHPWSSVPSSQEAPSRGIDIAY